MDTVTSVAAARDKQTNKKRVDNTFTSLKTICQRVMIKAKRTIEKERSDKAFRLFHAFLFEAFVHCHTHTHTYIHKHLRNTTLFCRARNKQIPHVCTHTYKHTRWTIVRKGTGHSTEEKGTRCKRTQDEYERHSRLLTMHSSFSFVCSLPTCLRCQCPLPKKKKQNRTKRNTQNTYINIRTKSNSITALITTIRSKKRVSGRKRDQKELYVTMSEIHISIYMCLWWGSKKKEDRSKRSGGLSEAKA